MCDWTSGSWLVVGRMIDDVGDVGDVVFVVVGREGGEGGSEADDLLGWEYDHRVWLGLAVSSHPGVGARNGRYETKDLSILYRLVVLILG